MIRTALRGISRDPESPAHAAARFREIVTRVTALADRELERVPVVDLEERAHKRKKAAQARWRAWRARQGTVWAKRGRA